MTQNMPKIQLIIEVESAGHLANTLIQMASRYKLSLIHI